MPPGPPPGLSKREVEVLRMIALGHTTSEIADEAVPVGAHRGDSPAHRAHIQQNLRRGSRADLVRYALEHHLIEG